MNRRHTALWLVGCAAIGIATVAGSQGPATHPAGAGAAADAPSHTKPTNLKVLPKNISGGDLDRLMKRFTQDLGVRCGYCHDENSDTKKINYESDENPVKETARFMIKMNEDINTKYLGQLGDRRYAEPLTCGNCHQGQVDPPTFQPKEQR